MAFGSGAFTFRFPLPGTVEEDDADGFCAECAKLDLEQSFARAYDLYEGARRGRNLRRLAVYRPFGEGPECLADFYYVTSLGDRLARDSVQSCKLCNFLRKTTPDPAQGTYKLLAICCSESYLFEPPKRSSRGKLERRPLDDVDHNVFLAVVPEVPGIPRNGIPLRWIETDLPRTGAIYRHTGFDFDDPNRLTMARRIGPQASLGLPVQWLDLCREFHACCAPKKPRDTSLQGFRVIDCVAKPPAVVSRAWSEKYVALSYVWGPPSGDWPPTILDAVEVTRRLGERFLWVDRLCINQSNPNEKQYLVSRMDDIYQGAEVTIIAAAGDARTGLPGINSTPRQEQPNVQLPSQRPLSTSSAGIRTDSPVDDDPIFKMMGVTEREYDAEREGSGEWLDLNRHGMRQSMQVDVDGFMKEKELLRTYGISEEDLRVFQDLAEDFGQTIDEFLKVQKELAKRMGVPLQNLVGHMKGKMAEQLGLPPEEGQNLIIAERPITRSSKPEKPLPQRMIPGRPAIISALEDARVTIRNSEWATRGWTYQEGVLSNRRLVFTDKQMYWECRSCSQSEAVAVPLERLVDDTGTRMADYNLAGIFDGDIHRSDELEYGYRLPNPDNVTEQVLRLDRHVKGYTSRTLGYDSDSLSAFMGVAARYTGVGGGLALLLGIPVWSGFFANSKPGLQDSFALSLATWTHTAPPPPAGATAMIYMANCRRREQFPSWTWAGWQGSADFAADNNESEVFKVGSSGMEHVDFFTTLTSRSWVSGIAYRLWSAKLILHAADGSESTLLTGHVPIANIPTSDPSKEWLLTVKDPFVLRHLYLVHSEKSKWRRLVGRSTRVHLSVPVTEAELVEGHRTHRFVSVLLFASVVPFVFNGVGRFMILQKADATGTRWERIGSIVMTVEESEMRAYKSTDDMISGMPVRKFEGDIVMA